MEEAGPVDVPVARPEFRNLSESEVWEAIHGVNAGENPVTGEVARLAIGYLAKFRDDADQHGNAPAHIMHVRVRWPIERVAVLLLAVFIRSEGGLAYPVTVQ